ncbi:DUF7287 family protein [Halovenus salina]|uniref:Flagellin N-terminal-like domain-containing protein n=1 Tax=Halovenus salina TaxID=1510225 RepID=A0ABD5VWH8_9EURY|nr:hypothetical protein [Halovenus salina]
MRAQTTIDFAIGIAIFLSVLVFAFSFVPGILQPFELSGEENPSLSDRAADSLSQELLGSAERPSVLNRYCTVAFFNESNDASGRCNYDAGSPSAVLNLDTARNVNVTLNGNVTTSGSGSEQLCWTESSPANNGEPGLVERSHAECAGDAVVLARGDDIVDQGDATITARRVVSLHGRSVTLAVVLW